MTKSTNEDQALALLAEPGITAEQIEGLTRDEALMKSRRVLRAVVSHPKTPRHVALPRARHLHTFELMQAALAPAIPPDVRRFIEELLLKCLGTLTAGERLTLARRASARVAAALLRDSDARVMQAALQNPRVTEAALIRALNGGDQPLVHAVCRHQNWSLRKDVQIALLRNPFTPGPRAAFFVGGLGTSVLRDLLCYVPESVRAQIESELQRRAESGLL
jgi:hypothetical protein